jgi:hypothetical protein
MDMLLGLAEGQPGHKDSMADVSSETDYDVVSSNETR